MKKIIAALCTCVLLFSCTVMSCSAETLGDANLDGKLNITDAAVTAAYVKGLLTLSEEQRKAADINRDGTLNISDAALITYYVKGGNISEPKDELSELEKNISAEISNYSGEWSVYVKKLDTGAELSINPQQMYSASLIKLFALGAAYDEIEKGNIAEEDISAKLAPMITVSDNASFNDVVMRLGEGFLTQWCSEHGFTQTRQTHHCQPAWNYYMSPMGEVRNATSAKDAGKILEQIYDSELVSKEASEKMLALLLAQQRRTKIPAGLPYGTKCANKTGETADYCHDAAIVFTDSGDYIIVVMVKAEGYAYSCGNGITKLSSMVYSYISST